MENDILDSLNDLGYEGPLSDEVAFAKALDGGPKSLEFTKLIHILAEELKKLCNLEETVNIINNVDESSSFLLELSSFLKELGCPYKCLVTGHMSSRLQSKEDRLLLLDYMISELMAARMVQVDCPREKQAPGMEIVMQESPTAKDLKDILISLKFNKPPPNITVELLFSKLEAKLKDTIQKEGDKLVGKPLYNKALSDKDWKNLETAFSEMYEEYRLRRETLITRLECTIQSFEWSDRLKSKKDTIQSVYRPKRSALTVKPAVKLCDFLAARTELLHVEKTASASVRKNTRSDVNKVVIGRVPDRGGRPNEQQPPPPEMPSWQQRSAPQVSTQRNLNNQTPTTLKEKNTPNYISTPIRKAQHYQSFDISLRADINTQSNQNINKSIPMDKRIKESSQKSALNKSTPMNKHNVNSPHKSAINKNTNIQKNTTQCKEFSNPGQKSKTYYVCTPDKSVSEESILLNRSEADDIESSDDVILCEDREGGGGGGRGGGRGGGDMNRGGRGGGRGGGRVQGGYSQATGQEQPRPQTSPAFNQNRNYQTYEVPPGGYNNYQNNGNYDNRGQDRGYNQGYGGDNSYQRQNSYDSSGSYNQTYNQGGGGGGYKTYQQTGYQSNRGYQNEHDDRRGRGGYRGRR